MEWIGSTITGWRCPLSLLSMGESNEKILRSKLINLLTANIRPIKIVATLQAEESDSVINLKDIYKFKYNFLQAQIGHYSTTLEGAIFWLREKNYFVRLHQTDEGRLPHLFFASPAAIEKLCSVHDVISVVNMCSAIGSKKAALFSPSFTAKERKEDMIPIL